jgi:DMSO/TMAO reductase YedYZ heme-binding membrane subunit
MPVATGILAVYATATVLASSWLRRRVGTTWWRRLHGLAVPMFCLAMIHGVFAGTDTSKPWMWWTYVGSGAVILFLVAVRGLTGQERRRRAPVATRSAARPGDQMRPSDAAWPASRHG